MCDLQPLNDKEISGIGPRISQGRVLTKVADAHASSIKQRPVRTALIVVLVVTVVILAAVAGALLGDRKSLPRPRPPDPEYAPPPSPSIEHVFKKSAVCTDAPMCSIIGRRMLKNNGTAVDAAIAAMFCNGLLNHQSMGLGGGFLMTVFIKQEEKAYSVIARETAPGAATKDMYHGNSVKASKGPLSVGVPGDVRGLWEAHKRWGKLPWKTLMEPTLDICSSGYQISKALSDAFVLNPSIKNDANLRKTYVNPETGEFLKAGKTVFPTEALCSTLRRIADNGGDDLYNGTLADDFLADLQRVGSIITADDLSNYKVTITEPIAVPLSNGDVLYTPPPPSSGVILVNILNILTGYNFNSTSIQTTGDQILTYHRILEAFKYSFATRTKLGDVDFLDLKELLRNVTDPEYGNGIRSLIDDNATSNSSLHYGADEVAKGDGGTAHISIIAANGDAVSITSSINFFFGASFTTLKTGIVMNNVMDDFSSPGIVNYFHVKPASANFIMPGKRPLSSMAPSIIVDSSGNAKMVIGASGGTKIISAIALVVMRKLWFDQSIKEAVDAPRIHHQLYPMHAEYEYGITQDLLKGLREKGHGAERYEGRGSIICALFANQTAIYANADFRKGGDVSGE